MDRFLTMAGPEHAAPEVGVLQDELPSERAKRITGCLPVRRLQLSPIQRPQEGQASQQQALV